MKVNNDVEFVSLLLHARNQIHIFHFQTKQYSKHIAFEELYTNLLTHTDKFVEVLQGKKLVILNGYKTFQYETNDQIGYLEELISVINEYRENNTQTIEMSTLDDILIDINTDIEQTIYKLQFLA